MRVIFMGTPEFAAQQLAALQDHPAIEVVLVVSQPDRPQGRHRELLPTPVAKLAREAGLALIQPARVKTVDFIQQLAAVSPDIIVTAAYGRILIPEVLAIPRLGCVNVHASLLPRYRGASPVQWSIINGDEVTGITYLLMDSEMDHGPILRQIEVPIPEYVTAGQLMDRLAEVGAADLVQVLLDYADGRILPREQNHADATTVGLLDRDSGRIDWTQSAYTIHNLIRGTNPWPGGWSTLDGKRLKIHRSKVDDYPEAALAGFDGIPEPGTLVECRCDRIVAACGEGYLNILELQLSGGRRLPASEISHNLAVGSILGGPEHPGG